MGNFPEVVEILAPERLIEAVVRFYVSENLGRDRFFGGEGPAGDKAHHEKSRRDNNKKHGDNLHQAAKDKAKHSEKLGHS